ncbi:alpha/beta hydrolase [Gayadomonas joobiniege]|uniref:alpha/beta hydrolase n=1 Tax=Gayadomonas joobiniege TaxID=1234606 RepID=UPI00036CD10D|nr:dienelactone hydrolase family protein [Gayadomonas joobiniege]
MAKPLEYIDVNPAGDVKKLVVWMHGLGDSGHGFAPIVPQLKLSSTLGVRFVFPHAPQRAVTINNGLSMPAWYDIKNIDFASRVDMAGVSESASSLIQLIETQLAEYQLTYQDLVIAGFSQGGVMTYHLAHLIQEPCAGLLALSCYSATPEPVKPLNKNVLNTPVMAMHGRADNVVPFELGKAAAEKMQSAGFTVTWHDYAMQHNVCPQQIEQISTWLTELLA